MYPHPTLFCPLCGGANQCAPASEGSFEVDCWCKTQPVSAEARTRAARTGISHACICPRCAAPLKQTRFDCPGSSD
ncbi:cysteine-rich CWC family protein [Cellvibrio japonicus]|uniref:cysteine-rich CWC family protein n=1 Tax=Cellvibrio japonicus TaxID=155077 RepID=UPI0013050EC7